MDVYFIEAKTSSKNIEKVVAGDLYFSQKPNSEEINLWNSFRVMETKEKEYLNATCVLALDSGLKTLIAMKSITETTLRTRNILMVSGLNNRIILLSIFILRVMVIKRMSLFLKKINIYHTHSNINILSPTYT